MIFPLGFINTVSILHTISLYLLPTHQFIRSGHQRVRKFYKLTESYRRGEFIISLPLKYSEK